MRRLLLSMPALLLAAPAVAADLNVTVQIPQLDVAEYHRPYTAVWVEREDHSVAAQLAVWYAQKESKEGAGTKWLPELRQWWRRGGRDLQMPVDGVSGATRPAGDQRLSFHEGKAPLGQLARASTNWWWRPHAKWVVAKWCACRSPGPPPHRSSWTRRAAPNWAPSSSTLRHNWRKR